MTTSHAAKPALDILGPRDLELGPFALGEARAGRRRRGSTGGCAPTKTASPGCCSTRRTPAPTRWTSEMLTELDAVLAKIEQDRPRGLVIRSAKPGGFIAGADIAQFRGVTDRRQGRGAADARPRDARPARPPAAADRRRHPRLLPRRRARSGARLRSSASPSTTRASAFPKCCSACIPASAARCGCRA